MPLGGFAPCPLPLGGTATDGLVAEQHARIATDLKSVVATAPFAVITLSTDSTIPSGYIAQHNVGIANAPSITLNGTGDVTLTWAASYLDEYDNAWPVNIQNVTATPHDSVLSSGALMITANIVNSRTVRLYSVLSGTGAVDAKISVVVW